MPGVALAPGHVPGPDSAPGAGGSRREVRSRVGGEGRTPTGPGAGRDVCPGASCSQGAGRLLLLLYYDRCSYY